MDEADETASWGRFKLAYDDDGDGSIPTNGNALEDGLLTQAFQENFASDDDKSGDNDSYVPSERLEFIEHSNIVQSPRKSPHKPSPAKSTDNNATSIRSLLHEENVCDPYLVAQSKRLFAEHTGENIDIDSSSSIDESESSEDSSIEEETKVATPIQVRRARNILRHTEFAKSLNLGGFSDGLKADTKSKPKKRSKEEASLLQFKEEQTNQAETRKKKRGMIFSTTSLTKKPNEALVHSSAQSDTIFITNSKSRELEAKYPGRTMQIKLLSSELEKVVRNTKLAWQAKIFSRHNFSEARHDDNIQFASPAPILVSGSGGTGKTSVVCDVIDMLREKIDSLSDRTKRKSEICKRNIISYAYVDCASTSGVDVAFVLNSAFKQLHDCYHPKASYEYKDRDELARDKHDDIVIKRDKHVSSQEINLFEYADDDVHESDDDQDGFDAEILFEQGRQHQRKQIAKRKSNNGTKRQSLDKGEVKDNRSRARSSRFHREARRNSSKETKNAEYEVQRSSRHTYDSSPVALFGRAVSMLLQGELSGKMRPKYGRCAFLVLDNAERIQSWKKAGSRNALAQLFKLPNIIGVNLTIIFISRGSLLSYSGLTFHKSIGMITDAAHPLQIHFHSYANVESLKLIFHTSRIQLLVTGQFHGSYKENQCAAFHFCILELKDIIYKSMINSFLQVISSYLSDISEIVRLARMLWPEFIAIVDKQENNQEYQAFAWQIMYRLRKDNGKIYPSCTNNKCQLCNMTNSDDSSEFNCVKGNFLEKLDHNIRETVRRILANVLMMPGRVIQEKNDKPYAERLPYTTKFLLLAAFLCQQKRPEQDVNLFTTINTGRRSSRGSKQSEENSAFAFSASDLKQLRAVRIPSFPIERLFSVFTSIIGQYGRSLHQANKVADMGTEELFKVVSSLIAGGLLRYASNTGFGKTMDRSDLMMEKVTCTLSKDDAHVIANSVGFPLDKYCV